VIYLPRSRWGARHGLGHPTRGPQVRVVIHHAPERRLYANPTHDEVAAHIRVIEQWHADHLTPTNPRIGYHWVVVDQTGDIWEGLGWGRIGAHVGGHNTTSLGILILGIDGRHTVGQPHTWQAVQRIVRQGIRRGSLIADPEMAPHNRFRATICPGDHIAHYVNTMTLEEDPTMPDDPKPEVKVVDSTSGLRFDPPTIPKQVVAYLERPAPEAVSALSKPGDTLADFLCGVLPAVLDAYGNRLPALIPVALVRLALAKLLRCP
jgi:peptidoglycan recognition protein